MQTGWWRTQSFANRSPSKYRENYREIADIEGRSAIRTLQPFCSQFAVRRYLDTIQMTIGPSAAYCGFGWAFDNYGRLERRRALPATFAAAAGFSS